MSEVSRIRFHGLDALHLQASDGASAIVTCHGAHVVSWIPADGDERLYLSEQSAMQEGAPIRGGIPVIFPQFATYGPLPHHGFARTRIWMWRLAETEPIGKEAGVRLRLEDSPETYDLWPHRFAAELSVGIDNHRLKVQLLIENTDRVPFDFTAALHTYLRVLDVRLVRLDGLQGTRFRDRTRSDLESEDTAEAITIAEEVDRIYLDAPDTLRLREPNRSLGLHAEGFPEVVVWNPWITKCALLPDMPDQGYLNMLCVEAAAVARPIRLEAGERWIGTQVLDGGAFELTSPHSIDRTGAPG